MRLIRAFRDCKQRSSTVSKEAPTVSKKASPISSGFRTFLSVGGFSSDFLAHAEVARVGSIGWVFTREDPSWLENCLSFWPFLAFCLLPFF